MHNADRESVYQEYELQTGTDGRISGICRTNDNLDRGYPSEDAEWTVDYRNHEEMKRRTGLSHTGVSGVVVLVMLDGIRI